MNDLLPALIGLFLFCLAMFLVWIFSRSKPKLAVSCWGDLQENKILISLIDEFQRLNPGVNVIVRRFPSGEYTKAVLSDIQRGTGPDVMFIDASIFPDLYFAGILRPLDPFLKSTPGGLEGYYPEAVGSFSAGGQSYAVPRDTAPICVVYYNKRVFDEAHLPYPKDSWDWDTFLDTAKKLTKASLSGEVTRWGVVEHWSMHANWVYSAGGSYVDDLKNPTRWTFAGDPAAAAGIQFRADLIQKHRVMHSSLNQAGSVEVEPRYMFVNGTAAMFISGIWVTPYFRENIKDFNWDVAMLPRGPEGKKGYFMAASGYGIAKGTANPKQAWKLVKFLTGEEGARKFASEGLTQPALMKVAESEAFLDGKPPLNKKMLLEAPTFGKGVPLCRNWSEIQDLLTLELDEVWKGRRTVGEAMGRLKPLLEKKPPATR
jgi:multiple sugar transport system substrate-binding protein